MKSFLLSHYVTKTEIGLVKTEIEDSIASMESRLNQLINSPEKKTFAPYYFLEQNKGTFNANYSNQEGEYYIIGNKIYGGVSLMAAVTDFQNVEEGSYINIMLPSIPGKHILELIVSPMMTTGLGASYPRRGEAEKDGKDPGTCVLDESQYTLSCRTNGVNDFVTVYSMGWACIPSGDGFWNCIFTFTGILVDR